jgi:hypothetical protein
MRTTQELIQIADQLFSSPERQNNVHLWDELSEFLLNNQSGLFLNSGTHNSIGSKIPGSKKTQRVYSSIGMQAAQDLSAAFQGTITNPATVWSKIRMLDEDLNNDDKVVSWIADCNTRMHHKFAESNLYNEFGKAYQSFVVLANLCLLQEEDPDTKEFIFTSLHLSQLAWAENMKGLVDMVCRKFEYTAKQCIERWGDKNHESILKAYEKNPQQVFEFLHCIYPRDKGEYSPKKLTKASDRPIASIYIDLTNNVQVEEGGYYEMPIFSARWGLMPGERYGRGPGHLALPDVRTLNTLVQRGLETLALQVRPPILANSRDIIGPVEFKPGALSIVNNHVGFKEFVTQANVPAVEQSKKELANNIKALFFLDKLLLPPRTETGEMTAFEISQRVEQMQRVLGPVLSRLNQELLSPLIVRSFKSMLRNNEFLPTPDILLARGINIDIVFVNQLARAQQIQDVSVIQQWVQGLSVIAQAKPEVLDNIDVDGLAKHTAKVLGVPEEAIANDPEIKKIREQRAKAQQAATIGQAAMTASTVGKNLGVSVQPPQ